MSVNKPNISQIRKYLNGELDAHAMHKLERQALDDPFLMDALEGYERNSKTQQADLNDLQNRLQQRIAPAKKRTVQWPAIAIAASVLLFISAGSWWLLNYRPAAHAPNLPANDKTAVTLKKLAPAKTLPPIKQDSAVLSTANAPAVTKRKKKPEPVFDNVPGPKPSSLLAADEAAATIIDSTAKGNKLNEVIVTGYGTQSKRDIIGSVTTVKPVNLQQTLAGRVAGISVNSKRLNRPNPTDTLRLITGQVTAKNDGKPLPGVNVGIAGTTTGTITDAEGRFKIQATNNDELNVAYIGFESEHLKLKGKDSLNVALKGSHQALSEVVVGYGITKKVDNKAHPVMGWSAFNKYLKNNTEVIHNKPGVVRLSFTVNADNSITGFKILKSLSKEADQEAVKLIEKGPAWLGNTNGKPETVKIRVRFEK